MTNCIPVRVGSLVLDGNVDGFGVKWDWTELPGWWDGAAVTQDWLSRAGASGVILGSSRYGGRAVIVRGVAEMTTAPYPSAWAAAADRLAAATDLVEGAGGLMTVEEATPKQLTVYRAREPRLRSRAGMRMMDFEIPLQAEGFRKLGTTLRSAGAGTVTNSGNKHTTPVVRVTGTPTTGDAGPIRVTNATDGGKWVEVSRGLAAGEVLTIDMDALTVTSSVAGDVAGNLVAGSRFWHLLVGANTVSHSGGGTLAVEYRDAYI